MTIIFCAHIGNREYTKKVPWKGQLPRNGDVIDFGEMVLIAGVAVWDVEDAGLVVQIDIDDEFSEDTGLLACGFERAK